LYLSNDAITNADTEHLKGFTALRRLDLSRTQITDAGLVQLVGLTVLQLLDLSTTWVTGGGLAHLQGMTQLQELILRGSAVAEQPLQPLGNLTSLQALDLLLTRVTDADLAYLENLTGLHRLDLSHTRITDAGLIHLKGLTALQHLQLGGNAITDAGLEHLTGLTQLRRLDLSETQLTDAGLERLKALTELEQLDLSGSKITGPGLAHLEGLTKLQSLSLNGTPITGTGLGHLKTLTELRFLTLRESQITDGGLAYLEGMTKLQSLELTGTQITDAGLTHLEGMTGLEGLGLSRGRITDQGLEHLKNLPNLKQVNFDGHPTPSSALFSTGGAEKASPIQEANPTDIGATARNDALPSGWSLDYDDGLRAGGSTTWVSGMATDLASLEGIPMNMDTSDTSRENERYEFEVCSPKGERVGTIDIRTNRRDTSTSRITLKPGKYVLRYTRRFGTPGDNFRAYSGPFPVDLPQPGMYKLRFPPKLSNAEINGVLGGCYALNFERINDGYDLAGFIYLDPRLSKPYAINGLPAGTYRLSAVTQDDHGNNLVSQAQATVRAGEKLTVNIAPPLRGDCSLRGAIAGRPGTYWTPTRMPQQTERQWFVLIRTRGSGPVEQTNAYEAQTMDSRYVIRGGNIVQETADRASYSIRDIAPGEYTVTAIEHPWFEGVPIERQQSKLLTLRLGETATLDFDLGDPPVGLAALPPLDRIGHGDQVARTTGKRLLICFFDVTQRRSRNRLLELNERGPSLAAQNVQVLAVQACDVQTGTLDKWLKQNNIAFPVSRMAALGDDLRAAWGIKILPWLIATDDRHVVAAEGIELADLGEAIPR
jgi:Leucine-rich repeat (LRR) protein